MKTSFCAKSSQKFNHFAQQQVQLLPHPVYAKASTSAFFGTVVIVVNMSGAKTRVRPRHDRICAVCLEDLNGTVIILPCNHPLHGECHSNMFTAYEERLREYHEFYNNPHLDISAVDYADIPPKPARVCCPFSCPKELDRTDGKTILEFENRHTKLEPEEGETEKQIRKKLYKRKRNRRRWQLKQWAKEKKEKRKILLGSQ